MDPSPSSRLLGGPDHSDVELETPPVNFSGGEAISSSSPSSSPASRQKHELVSEFVGTFFLLFLGMSSCIRGELSTPPVPLLQTACLWGLALYMTARLVGPGNPGHFNPAVTVAMQFVRPSTRRGTLSGKLKKIGLYFLCQLSGSFLAACCVYLFNADTYRADTSLVYGSLIQRPSLSLSTSSAFFSALLAEIVTTGFLVCTVFSITSAHRFSSPPSSSSSSSVLPVPPPPSPSPSSPPSDVGVLVSLTLVLCITVCAPTSGAALNPARDLGPRILLGALGYGEAKAADAAIYFFGPIVGACGGAVIADGLLGNMMGGGRGETKGM